MARPKTQTREQYNAYHRDWYHAHRDDLNLRERSKAWNKTRNRERIEAVSRIKVEEGCIDCGYNAHPAALHFDHVRGVKSANIGRLYTANIDTLSAEILKCEVRCANCHAIITQHRKVPV